MSMLQIEVAEAMGLSIGQVQRAELTAKRKLFQGILGRCPEIIGSARKDQSGLTSAATKFGAPRVYVRWMEFAVKFFPRRYELVADRKATLFGSRDEAWATAQGHGLKLSDITFEMAGTGRPRSGHLRGGHISESKGKNQ